MVTGHVDITVVDQMIELALSAGEQPVKTKGLSPEAWRALRYAMARLAVDLVSGPAGLAAYLRTQLLEEPWNKPSLPLDIGWSDSIPWYIRKAVILRDRTCAWPGCNRPAVYCDVHHVRHKADGGETSVDNCALVCQFHHDVCIHRWGWKPDRPPRRHHQRPRPRRPNPAQPLPAHHPRRVIPARSLLTG